MNILYNKPMIYTADTNIIKIMYRAIMMLLLLFLTYLAPTYNAFAGNCTMPCSNDIETNCSKPNAWAGSTLCTGRPSSSNYFNPQIRMCAQVCFLQICTCDSIVLDGNGECGWVWNGPIPIRYCARVAAPGCIKSEADNKGFCTNGVNQSPFYGNNKPRMRVCGYQDPCDFTDTDACFGGRGHMPFHYNTPNPNSGGAQTAAQMLGSSSLVLLAVSPPLAIFSGIAAGIAALVGIFSSNINMWVMDGYGTKGCVETPGAPSPPPFCPVYRGGESMMPPVPTVTRVCSQGEVSKQVSPCVNTIRAANRWASTSNSFERTLIRVGFNNFIPICSVAKVNTSCVNIVTRGSNVDEIHTNYNDMLPQCDGSKSNAPCVEFVGYTPTSTATNGYRIAYYTPSGNLPASTVSDWFQDPCDAPAKGGSCFNTPPSGTCQRANLSLYGINDANFYDLGAYFANVNDVKTTAANQGAYKTQTIIDTNKNPRIFAADMNVDPMQICAAEITGANTTEDTGCFARPPAPAPIMAQCNQQQCSRPCVVIDDNPVCASSDVCIQQSCTSTNTNPKMVVGLGMGQDVVQQSSVDSQTNSNSIILHGLTFSTFITNDQNEKADSNGNLDKSSYYNPPNSKTKCFRDDPCNGGVIPGSPPGNSRTDNTCCYTKGLRFIASDPNKGPFYRGGGTKLCLNNNGGAGDKPRVLAKVIPDPNGGSTKVVSDNPLDVIKNPYYNCMQICYPGRKLPECTSKNCCNSCPNQGGCSSNQTDLAKIIDNQDINNPNNNTEGLRNQTAIEANLCVPIPQLTCNKIDSPGSDDGFATWDSANAADSKTGKCMAGYTQSSSGPPTRICYANGDNGAWGYVSNPCELVKCPEITTGGSGDGYAAWKSIEVNKTQIGTCNAGYNPSMSGAPSRNCSLNNGAGVWESVTNPCLVQHR